MAHMSIRTAMLLVTIGLSLLVGVTVGGVSILGLYRNIKREAQQRVNHDLLIAVAEYEDRIETKARILQERSRSLAPHVRALVAGASLDAGLAAELVEIKASHRLTVLNVCAADGRPLAGAYTDQQVPVPLEQDAVLRRALLGRTAHGTVKHGPERLLLEGGVALQKAATIHGPSPAREVATQEALFSWVAVPISDEKGRVVALLYGGRLLNHDHELVDWLQELIYGDALFRGKPVGTVTLFLDNLRIATNVRGPDRARAVGTAVSPKVERKVLAGGQRWLDRALVVDSWYLSAYQPVLDPAGAVIGMLYVGLLEAPYEQIARRAVLGLVGPVVALLLLAVVVSLLLVRRITSPLRELGTAAMQLKQANWEHPMPTGFEFAELARLGLVLEEMQAAIVARDMALQESNRSLSEKNRNYMEMLGFITHELKSPMSSAQQMLSVALGGYHGELPVKTLEMLERVSRALEQSQDMIKNYLDLSRAERGELELNALEIELVADVIEPVIEQTAGLFASKQIELELHAPEQVRLYADPELVTILLTNYLSNASKYGKDGGKARLEVRLDDSWIELAVWNEGPGFSHEEQHKLFAKFSRLRNQASRGARGSGLGLFLCKYIAKLHGGEVEARSEPGSWARFAVRLPRAASTPGSTRGDQ